MERPVLDAYGLELGWFLDLECSGVEDHGCAVVLVSDDDVDFVSDFEAVDGEVDFEGAGVNLVGGNHSVDGDLVGAESDARGGEGVLDVYVLSLICAFDDELFGVDVLC